MENTWCRKPDCKYHPDRRVLKFISKKCMICKYFVAKDNYVTTTK